MSRWTKIVYLNLICYLIIVLTTSKQNHQSYTSKSIDFNIELQYRTCNYFRKTMFSKIKLTISDQKSLSDIGLSMTHGK